MKPSLNPAVATLAAPPIPLVQRAAAAYDGARGPLLDLSQAAPGHAPPAALMDALGEAARDPASLGYGPIEGERGLREAWARDVARACGGAGGAAGVDVRADDVLVTAGCNQAFVAAALAVAGAGDAVLLITPWYFNHATTLGMLGIEAQGCPAREERGFVVDIEDVARRLGPRTRAVALVSPDNPTGAVTPPATLEALFELCRERGLRLILDETYRDFLPPGTTASHRLFERDWRDTLVSLSSFSKSCAIPGHRLGTAVAGPELLDAMASVQDNVQICAPRAPQIALARTLDGLVGWREANRATIARRTATLLDAMATVPDWHVGSAGAYFAWVRHPFAEPSAVVAERLAREHGILTLPGGCFGADHERWLRVAYPNVDEAGILAAGQRLRAVA